MKILISLLSFSILVHILNVECLNNGLALTPPMGWMTWQRYRCLIDCEKFPTECISENLIKTTAELMAEDGYLEAGYEYIVIDDCWSSHDRDDYGRLQPDGDRFPSGIPALSDFVHSLGLKFGIYADFGTLTCGGFPGSIDYLKIDAETFAEWNVDYVKFDGCYAEEEVMEDGYAEFGKYLNETGRPIVYSCSWPAYFESQGIKANYTKLAETCNLWRNWYDIDDSWTSVKQIVQWFGNEQDRISNFSRPGHWNDPDMLLLGNFGLSLYQSQAQMALWSVMAAPLLMSTDLKAIRPEYKAILQNKAAIKVNQDPLGKMGRRIYVKNDIEVWTKPIVPIINQSPSYAVVFVSSRTDGYPFPISVSLKTLGLLDSKEYLVENIFEGEYKDVLNNGNISVRVAPTGTVFLRLTPIYSKHLRY